MGLTGGGRAKLHLNAIGELQARPMAKKLNKGAIVIQCWLDVYKY